MSGRCPSLAGKAAPGSVAGIDEILAAEPAHRVAATSACSCEWPPTGHFPGDLERRVVPATASRLAWSN